MLCMDKDTATRIRETAHELIAERVYSGFSYADIAVKVGIRKASIQSSLFRPRWILLLRR